MSSFAKALLILTAVSGLSSCLAWTDPEYDRLVSRVETNPSPDKIVGLWLDTTPSAWSSTRITKLFRPSGSGRQRTVLSVAKDEPNDITFNWRYVGHGKWSMPGLEDRVTWQIADGKLLESGHGALGSSKLVFDRQE